MMNSLAGSEFGKLSGSPLMKLCEAGARYGMQELEVTISPDLLALVSPKARLSLRRNLRRDLARITRPCLELERTSFAYALQALGLPVAGMGALHLMFERGVIDDLRHDLIGVDGGHIGLGSSLATRGRTTSSSAPPSRPASGRSTSG